MHLRHPTFALSLLALFCASEASAQGFQLPNLNPFAGKKKVTRSGRGRNTIRRTGQPRMRPVTQVQPALKKSWIPDLRPSFLKPKARRATGGVVQKGNALERFGAQTGKLLETLNPFRQPNRRRGFQPKALRPPTGSRRSVKTKAKQTSLFPNLFGQTQPKRKKPRTALEFLKQPRVQR